MFSVLAVYGRGTSFQTVLQFACFALYTCHPLIAMYVVTSLSDMQMTTASPSSA